jgi:hypothetical protein
VYQQDAESNNLTLNVSDWTEGLYFVKVQTQSGWFIRRVSIVH